MERLGSAEVILVIGATGFVGSNLVRYLSNKGKEIVIFQRPDSNLKNLEGLNFKSAIGDFLDLKEAERSLYKAMQGCCAVYNLATCASFLKEHRYLREAVNKTGAGIVASVARRLKVRLIHISSSMAVGYPENGIIADEDFVFNASYDHYALSKPPLLHPLRVFHVSGPSHDPTMLHPSYITSTGSKGFEPLATWLKARCSA